MAEYDGSIKFSTKLDTSEFKAGIEKLSSEVSTGFSTVSKSIQNVSKTADKLSKNNSLKSFSKEFLKIGPTVAEVGKSASKSYQTMEKSVDSFNNTTAKSGAAMSDKFQTPVRSAVDASIGKINELNSKMDGSLGSAVKTAGGLFDSFSQTLIQASSTGMHPFSEAIEAIGRNFSGISGVINTCSTAIQTYQTATSLANTVSKTAEAISHLRAAGATKLQTVTALLTGTLTAESTVTAAKTVAEGAATAGTTAHATAQTTLNAAMSANPIGLVVTGLAALAVGIGTVTLLTNQETEEERKHRESVEENIDATERLRTANEQLSQTRESNVTGITSEFTHAKKLGGELKTIVDKNGKIEEKYRAHAQVILNELNPFLGTEYDIVDGTLQKSSELLDNLELFLEKQESQRLIESVEPENTSAIKNQTTAYENLMNAKKNLNHESGQGVVLESKYASACANSTVLSGTYNECLLDGLETKYDAKTVLNNFISDLNDETEALRESARQYLENEKKIPARVIFLLYNF